MVKLEADINAAIDTMYTGDKQARLISVNVEKLALMITRASLNKMSDELRSKITNHPNLDSYVRNLVQVPAPSGQ